MVNFLLALPIALAGFTVASSLATALGENTWWLASAGVTASLLLPALLASWTRSLLGGKRPEPGDAEGGSLPGLHSDRPTTAGTIVVLNLCLILASALLAPAQTSFRLRQHGAWWVRELATLAAPVQAEEITRKGERIVGWLAALIPGGGEAATAPDLPLAGDGGGALPAPDQGVAARSDGQETLAPGEEYLVSFSRQDSAVVVPVLLSGPAGVVKAKMIFDTGATLTTLDRATMARLGLVDDPAAPSLLSHTANGTVRRRLTIIDGAAMGAARVPRGLAVSICDKCAKGDVVGLLGLNFTRNFKVSMDHEAGRIGLAPKLPPPPATYDVRHFIKLDSARGLWRGPSLGVDLVVRNLAPRALRDVRIAAEVDAAGGKRLLRATLKEVPARGSKPLHMEGVLQGRKSRSFSMQVEHAAW